MNPKAMIEAMCNEIKQNLTAFCEQEHFEASRLRLRKCALFHPSSTAIKHIVEERPCFAGYERIIDFFHVTEHLSAAAEALFGKQFRQAENWYEKHRARLLREDLAPQAILCPIDYYLETLSLSKSRRQDALTDGQSGMKGELVRRIKSAP